MLKPLAPTLETLGLGGNKLGGTIMDDIAAFTKLTSLDLYGMDLKGMFVDTRARSARSTLRALRCDRARRAAAEGDAAVARETHPGRRHWELEQVHGRHPDGVELAHEPQRAEHGPVWPLGCVIRFQNAYSPFNIASSEMRSRAQGSCPSRSSA